ncbi:MAG: hypothetical protein HY791_26605 [Deltaproteobacteria bacterium]|nr:hypothetical protein [Deltaproteobacteria bacterium]
MAAGRARGANLTIAARVLPLGRECVLSIVAHDSSTSTSLVGADAKGPCSGAGLRRLVERAAAKLGVARVLDESKRSWIEGTEMSFDELALDTGGA